MRRLGVALAIIFVALVLGVALSLSDSGRTKATLAKAAAEADPPEVVEAPSPRPQPEAITPAGPAQELGPTNPTASLQAEQARQPAGLSNALGDAGTTPVRQSLFQRQLALDAAAKNWSTLIPRIRTGELDVNMVLVPATGNNFLRLAIAQGNPDVVSELLGVGAKPATREVVIAAGTGNLALLQRLQAAGADINVWDPETGQSPFVQAVRRGNLEMAQWLLDNGASIQPNSAGITPLDECVASGMGSVVAIHYLESKGFALTKDHLSLVHPRNPRAQEIRNYITARVGN